MDYIGLAILVATIVGAVRFVHIAAFKDGVSVGKHMGRLEVLEEDIARSKVQEAQLAEDYEIINGLIQEKRTRYSITEQL